MDYLQKCLKCGIARGSVHLFLQSQVILRKTVLQESTKIASSLVKNNYK
jgi:hypothetical protein